VIPQTDQQHGSTQQQNLRLIFSMRMIMAVFFLVILMVMTAAAFVTVVMLVMVAAAAFMIVVMLMMMTAAAFMVVVVLVMMTAATFMVVLVMMTAATFMIVVMLMVMAATTRIAVFMMMVMMSSFLRRAALGISGINLCPAFYGPGNFRQFRDQCIRILRSQPQLFRGKGDDGFLHILMIVEFLLDLRRTVGTVQIFNDIYFSGHPYPSCLISTYEQSFICYQYTAVFVPCQQKKPGTVWFRVRYQLNRGLIFWR
jgi:hypothetical protein